MRFMINIIYFYVGALSNQIGVAAGFYMPAEIATSPDKIHLLLMIQAGMTTGILALVISNKIIIAI